MLKSTVNSIFPLVSGDFYGSSEWGVSLEIDTKPNEVIAFITQLSNSEIRIRNDSGQPIEFECEHVKGELGPNLTLSIKKPMNIIFGVYSRPMSIDSFSVQITEE